MSHSPRFRAERAPDQAPQAVLQVLPRAVGAALAATVTGHVVGMTTADLLTGPDDFGWYAIVAGLLPLVLIPVLFGLFARWFGLPSALATALVGAPLYFLAWLALVLAFLGLPSAPTLLMLVSPLVPGLAAFVPIALLRYSQRERPTGTGRP
ncbi:hypothetical protein [Nocardiopsis nanhaiensis]